MELEKCLCLLAFWILYFLLFISPYVSIYEGSYQQTADIAADIVKKYGNYISEDEYEKMNSVCKDALVQDPLDDEMQYLFIDKQ